MHKHLKLKIKRVQEITQNHYQPGSHAHSYKAVWRRHVFPVYPMSYKTFLEYLGTPVSLNEEEKKPSE